MLLLLLNLFVLWCLVMIFFTVRSDQLVALMFFSDDLERDLVSIYQRLEDNARQRRLTDRDLAELKRQKNVLVWKLRALLVFLFFLHAPMAFARFLLGLFRKK